MSNIEAHHIRLSAILQAISKDPILSSSLVFKGGTALMMFHNLPRFSVDLDFTLTDKSVEKAVYNRLFSIAIEYGRIVDDNLGFFGSKIVISYGDNREWNLKIEVSNRDFGEEYEVLSLNGSPIKVMKLEDMYANKLVALTERKGVANRDIFDINFFEELGVSPRERIIEIRTGLNPREYLPKVLEVLKAYPKNRILSSLAPLLTPEYQKWAKQNLLPETIDKVQRRLSALQFKNRIQPKKGLKL